MTKIIKKETKRKNVSGVLFGELLRVIYPNGYTGDFAKWNTEWFLGWFALDINSTYDIVVETNVDCNSSIVFWVLHNGDTTLEAIEYYLRGVMHVLAPDMKSTDTLDSDHRLLTFVYPNVDADS